MIRFACPGCDLAMKCSSKHGAKIGKCPRCGTKFQIPQAAPVESIQAREPPTLAPPPPGGHAGGRVCL
jgi:hypothetical protein